MVAASATRAPAIAPFALSVLLIAAVAMVLLLLLAALGVVAAAVLTLETAGVTGGTCGRVQYGCV